MLRQLAIRALTRLSWGASPRRLAAGMNRFAQVEADSAWQLLQALSATDSVPLRARLFRNALEETQHAALFLGVARRHAPTALPLANARRRQLYTPSRGLAAFSAYLYVSEGDVYDQFFSYAAAASDESVRQTFLAIRGDEGDHESHAWRELVEVAGSVPRARALARRARLRRLYEAWLRFGKSLGALPSRLILTALYLVAAPLATWSCRRLIRRAQWTTLREAPAREPAPAVRAEAPPAPQVPPAPSPTAARPRPRAHDGTTMTTTEEGGTPWPTQ